MSIFGKLLKTTINIATSPIDIVKDVVTLGGTMTDQDKSYTSQKLEELDNNLEEIKKEADKL